MGQQKRVSMGAVNVLSFSFSLSSDSSASALGVLSFGEVQAVSPYAAFSFILAGKKRLRKAKTRAAEGKDRERERSLTLVWKAACSRCQNHSWCKNRKAY